MRDIQPTLSSWLENGKSVALATVISTWGSAPRRPGAMLAVTDTGDMVGSVSGGCVEGAVVQAAQKAIRSGQCEFMHFGVADETAWDVGLACGGKIDVFVQPLVDKTYWLKVLGELDKQEPLTLATVVKGTDHLGSSALFRANEALFSDGQASFDPPEEVDQAKVLARAYEEIFVNPILPSLSLIMIGGVHIAVALTQLAKISGYQTIIVDPRRLFGSQQRFSLSDRLVQTWPEAALSEIKITGSSAIVTLSHDPKIDDPALLVALNSPAFYVGALGSSTTHQQRLERLRTIGVSDQQLARIHAPIGLDIGARSPEEIAVAILAEIIKTYHT